MNFPLDNPLFQFLLWLVDTAGIGGIVVLLVAGGSISAYALTLRWIYLGGKAPESDVYAFPTSSLHSHEE